MQLKCLLWLNLSRLWQIFYLVTDSPQDDEDIRREEELEVVPASYNSHSLVFLDKFTEYRIQILAFNPAGDGPPSMPITVKTLQVRYSASPGLQTALSPNTHGRTNKCWPHFASECIAILLLVFKVWLQIFSQRLAIMIEVVSRFSSVCQARFQVCISLWAKALSCPFQFSIC
jgi:hypothetical protein